jgi:hypothetical protein
MKRFYLIKLFEFFCWINNPLIDLFTFCFLIKEDILQSDRSSVGRSVGQSVVANATARVVVVS